MTMEDQVQAIKERQNSFEAKVDMYMNMMNQQRAEDREESRAFRQEVKQEMTALRQETKQEMTTLRQEVSTAVKHIQNLSIVTMAGVGAMTLAIVGMVITVLMKN